ncbi:EF-hand, partial [Backusella circina FSU 941]
MGKNRTEISASISDEELASLKQAFALYDVKGNGYINLQDFGAIIKSLGIESDNEKIEKILKEIDNDHDGKINLDKFVKAMNKLVTRTDVITEEPESAGDELRRWDTYPAGESSKKKKKSSSYSDRMSRHEHDELKELFDKFDTNHNGQISMDELRDVMNGLGENLTEDDIKDMMDDADANNDGFIDFEEFKNLMP